MHCCGGSLPSCLWWWVVAVWLAERARVLGLAGLGVPRMRPVDSLTHTNLRLCTYGLTHSHSYSGRCCRCCSGHVHTHRGGMAGACACCCGNSMHVGVLHTQTCRVAEPWSAAWILLDIHMMGGCGTESFWAGMRQCCCCHSRCRHYYLRGAGCGQACELVGVWVGCIGREGELRGLYAPQP